MGSNRVVLRLVSENAPGSQVAASGGNLERAFRRYSPYVAAIALRLVGRNEEVDDVVQDVFLRAIKGMDQLRDADAIKGWLATVTVRVARRRLQLRRMRAWLQLDDFPTYGSIAPTASPEQRELLARVYAVLDCLPVEERLAWTLRHIEGERLESVASLCACSLATAKRRISAAQQGIDRGLSDE